MSDYISKWHKELEIFSKIKPLLILEGDVLDSYQYPKEGRYPEGEHSAAVGVSAFLFQGFRLSEYYLLR